MAEEAALENLPVNSFFCHKCNREISSVLPDFTCPTCQCGFIEALNNPPEQNDDSDMDLEGIPFDEALNVFHDMLFTSGNEERRGRGRRSGRENFRAGRMRQFNIDAPIETLFQDFVMNLAEVGGGWAGSNTIGVGTGRGGGGPVLLLGNPGDYAWGREGLDAIVTQLLNQMDTTGPPPLAKEKINEIPTTVITKEQADINLQCSVCWEDFKVDEPVRKLPCEHVYHENCIIPWLELHGTCPICRKTLIEDGRAEDSDSSRNNVVGNSLATLFRYASENNSRTPSSSSTTSSSGNNTSTSSSSRPDFNMDIDYD
ncbi:E3 ubiquitin-protein ligase RNF126-B isoform X2 [Cimex lectularius]|uniref:RING-type E3 ubiquitin transferase n=1 Tax=Cimex lectularius TaxID=79782 RepID=A0A8I6RW39_CIMLE|nr:E3 ubiquitin-protein ligase RNF126-B isoform X2 [Cimex lectularius]